MSDLPLYVIRNTTHGCESNDHNISVLVDCVHEFVNRECEVIVVNSWEQRVPEEYDIINLDPFTRKGHHYTLDICRQFAEDQSKPNGFASRTGISIEDQLSLIPSGGKYIIVDDDISSGATKRFVESITSHLNVVDYISLLRLWCDENGYIGREIYDCIDTHDFWGNLPSSGLMVNGKRCYYWIPEVDLCKRANLNDGASEFLKSRIVV